MLGELVDEVDHPELTGRLCRADRDDREREHRDRREQHCGDAARRTELPMI
jgi:hypothetical protein